jgi:ABC-type uncharacterized transport system permease subunit
MGNHVEERLYSFFVCLFFTFRRSKLDYNNHNDKEIVIMVNISNTKAAPYHTTIIVIILVAA